MSKPCKNLSIYGNMVSDEMDSEMENGVNFEGKCVIKNSWRRNINALYHRLF